MNRRAGKPTIKKTTQLVNVEEHVEGFRQVREAHRRELIDDYVELFLKVLNFFLKVPLHKHKQDLEAFQSYQLLHNFYS